MSINLKHKHIVLYSTDEFAKVKVTALRSTKKIFLFTTIQMIQLYIYYNMFTGLDCCLLDGQISSWMVQKHEDSKNGLLKVISHNIY